MNNRETQLYSGAAFTLEWYYNSQGISPALKFFNTLDPAYQDSLLRLAKRMGDFGRISNWTQFRSEGDGIFAFKPGPYRFLCFFTAERRIIITNGCRKKSDKLPRREKDSALQARADYFKRKLAGVGND